MAWTWLRPDWLYALAVPLALLLTAALPARPVDVPVGAIAVWRRIAEHTRGVRGRRRPSLELLCVVAALALAVLALARPVTSSAAAVERWQVVVDTSPSCALPWNGTTAPRLVVAAEALAEWARERSAAVGRTLELEWTTPGRDTPRSVIASELSGAASALVTSLAARGGAASYGEPDWVQHDRAGVLWLTDCVRHASLAGVFASGGDAVHGPIGEDAGRTIVWGADGTLALGEAVPPGSLVLQGAVAPELALVAELFAEERRLTLVRGDAGPDAPPPRLTLRAPVGALEAVPEHALVGRDGWRARVRGVPAATSEPSPNSESSPPWEPSATSAWLTDPRGRVWCREAPGLVAVDTLEVDVDPGSEAAFAASWAALFDTALLPSAGSVPYAERQACGATVVLPPAAQAVPPPSEERRERAPWLGAFAALAALGAAALLMAAARPRR